MSPIYRNKPFHRSYSPNKWRRLAIGSWRAPNDPTIYGMLEMNAEAALKHIELLRKKTGERITITHFTGKVIAEMLKRHPELNTELRWGRLYPRASIDICFQIAMPANGSGHHDLSSGAVRDVDKKTLSEVASILNGSSNSARASQDPLFKGIKKIGWVIPGPLLGIAVTALKFILNTLNLWSPILGVPRHGFGSALVTNVGSLGLDWAMPALFPPANVPMILALGSIYEAPVYEKDENNIVIRTRLERHVRLSGAFDHRYLDGLHAAEASKTIRDLFANPASF